MGKLIKASSWAIYINSSKLVNYFETRGKRGGKGLTIVDLFSENAN